VRNVVRAHHFTEEVEILSEEMSWVLRFFLKEKGEVGNWPSMSAAWAEAHRAYAERQSGMYSAMRARCARLWKDLPEYISRMNAIIDLLSLESSMWQALPEAMR